MAVVGGSGTGRRAGLWPIGSGHDDTDPSPNPHTYTDSHTHAAADTHAGYRLMDPAGLGVGPRDDGDPAGLRSNHRCRAVRTQGVWVAIRRFR